MIILASNSPTRQDILRRAGLSFSAVAPLVDERQLTAQHTSWSPAETARNLAHAKAIDVSLRFPDAFVIGADQVLAHGTKIFGKPISVEQCREHLLELRGKPHILISSIVCASAGTMQWSHTAKAMMTMRMFSEAFLDTYLKEIGHDCLSSVGGYKIEGRGIQLFDTIDGDYFTILGLPLIPLLEKLRSLGEIHS